nr:uncharacterized protein B0416.5-like [Cherax quadricarinatus]
MEEPREVGVGDVVETGEGVGEGKVKVKRGRGGSEPPAYRSYPQRWAILLAVTLLNISNASLWINLAPVSYKAADYFKVPVAGINWFSLVYLFVSIPFCFISTFIVNALGLRPSIQIGSALNCLGAVIRGISTSGLIPSCRAQYAVCITGQVLAGMAQSFLLFIPTKVSQLWFPENSRTLSTTVLSLSNPLGVVVAQVLSPILIKYSTLPILNYVYCGMAVFTQLITLVSVTRAFFHILPVSPYHFSSLLTLSVLAYLPVFSGIINGVMILCGFVGSAVTGIMADRTKAFTPITKISYGIATIFNIIMMEMFMVPGQPAVLAIFMGLFGFFGIGAYPIGLELAVEATYPVEESISTAFIFMSGQVQGVLIIFLVSYLARDPKPEYAKIEVCTAGINSDILPKDYTEQRASVTWRNSEPLSLDRTASFHHLTEERASVTWRNSEPLSLDGTASFHHLTEERASVT